MSEVVVWYEVYFQSPYSKDWHALEFDTEDAARRLTADLIASGRKAYYTREEIDPEIFEDY